MWCATSVASGPLGRGEETRGLDFFLVICLQGRCFVCFRARLNFFRCVSILLFVESKTQRSHKTTSHTQCVCACVLTLGYGTGPRANKLPSPNH